MGTKNKYTFLRVLAMITGFWLVMNMILGPLFWHETFIDNSTLAPVELLMLPGYIGVLLFDFFVIIKLIIEKALNKLHPNSHDLLLIGGFICLFLLMAIKVMADEVGHQSREGLGISGEFILLNILMAIQILYNYLFLRITKTKLLSTSFRL